jgi:MtrB/PioB family decaheme-associated outer membrane protein
MSKKTYSEFKQVPVAAALLLAFGGAYAQQTAEVMELITPESSLNAGIGGVSNTREAKRFGQYTGLNQDASLLVDFEMIKRDEVTGTWTTLTGRNLGLDTRELGYSRQKQGDWKYALDYNEIVRNDPYVINTGMTGVGTTTPTIKLIATPSMPSAWAAANGIIASNGIAGSEVELKLKRTALGLSGEKWISPELQLELNFRNEDKNGSRMFGRAGLDSSDMLLRPKNGSGSNSALNVVNANGGWALLLTPEPINSTIRTMEGKLNFNRGNLALSGGYYGSFYINENGNLSPNVPGTLNRGSLWNVCATAGCSTVQQLASSPVALPPDNQAHQFYLSGTYAHSQTTRTNFKLSYTHATQDESYVGMGLTPAAGAPSSLGAVVDTTLAQFGLTMRPSKDLSVNASLRYEDRNDKTPIYAYNNNGKTGDALSGTNNWGSGSQTRTSAKVDGVYRLAAGYSALLGADWESKNTPLPPSMTGLFANQVLFREKLDEYGVHAGLRKAMSETLNGALSFEVKQRRGDDNGWFTTQGSTTAPNTNQLITFDPASASTGNRVLPIMYMDRDRTKVRGNLDWAATEKLSVQAVIEHGQDDFKRAWNVAPQIVPTIAGARVMTNNSLTLDASYKVSDDWRLSGFWTYSENRWNVNKAGIGEDTFNKVDTFGLGIKGKMTARMSVGMDILVSNDVTSFNNVIATSNVGGAGNIAGWAGQTLPGNYLPNITYKTAKLNLFSVYEVDKKSAIKVNLVYQEFKNDDWQWGYNGVPFVYSDNTTVSNPNQSVTFLGVSYLLKF